MENILLSIFGVSNADSIQDSYVKVIEKMKTATIHTDISEEESKNNRKKRALAYNKYSSSDEDIRSLSSKQIVSSKQKQWPSFPTTKIDCNSRQLINHSPQTQFTQENDQCNENYSSKENSTIFNCQSTHSMAPLGAIGSDYNLTELCPSNISSSHENYTNDKFSSNENNYNNPAVSSNEILKYNYSTFSSNINMNYNDVLVPSNEVINYNNASEVAVSSYQTVHSPGNEFSNINREVILRKLNQISQTPEIILEKLTQLELKSVNEAGIFNYKTTGNVNNVDDTCYTIVDRMPFKSISELNEFEQQKLENKIFFKKTVHDLKRIGGTDITNIISNIMKRLMSNSLAEQYSFAGAKSMKQSFKSLLSFKLLLAIVYCHKSDVTEVNINEIVGKWLIQAKTRRTREEMKAAKKLMLQKVTATSSGEAKEPNSD